MVAATEWVLTQEGNRRPPASTPPQIDRSRCRANRHGDETAYRLGCRCPDAIRRNSRYHKEHRLGIARPRRVDACGTRRRLRALYAAGHGRREILQHTKHLRYRMLSFLLSGEVRMVRAVVDEDVRRVYDLLSRREGRNVDARERAEREWWSPPSAWTGPDLDDPSIEDVFEEDFLEEDFPVDSALLERIVVGHATAGELAGVCGDREVRLWLVAHLTERDPARWSASVIARLLRVPKRMVERDRSEWRHRIASGDPTCTTDAPPSLVRSSGATCSAA